MYRVNLNGQFKISWIKNVLKLVNSLRKFANHYDSRTVIDFLLWKRTSIALQTIFSVKSHHINIYRHCINNK